MELYFAEPWYAENAGDCRGWRIFDVALNGKTVLKNLDILEEAGSRRGIRKKMTICTDGEICLSFPKIKSGQAVICAVALLKTKKERKTK